MGIPCRICGSVISENSRFCNICGNPMGFGEIVYPVSPNDTKQPVSLIGVLALVLGITAVLFSVTSAFLDIGYSIGFAVFSLITSVFAIISLVLKGSKVYGIVGLTCSVLGLLFDILYIILDNLNFSFFN